MASGVFTIARGTIAAKVRQDGTAFGMLLLKAAEPDVDLVRHTTVADLLAAAGNTEADFTNYTRKSGITATLTVDQNGNEVTADIPDQVWGSAGSETGNVLQKAIVYYAEGATDSDLVPLTHHDFNVTTAAGDLSALISFSGFWAS